MGSDHCQIPKNHSSPEPKIQRGDAVDYDETVWPFPRHSFWNTEFLFPQFLLLFTSAIIGIFLNFLFL